MAGLALHAGALACIGIGLLRFLDRSAFVAGPIHSASYGVRRLGRVAVSTNGGPGHQPRQSGSGWSFGFAGLGLCLSALRTSGRRRSQPWRPRWLRRAKGSGPSGGNGDNSGEAGGGTGADTPEATPDELVEELESKMHRLARVGKYEDAAAVRDELSNAQVDDEAHVLQANTELYSAFTARDITRMKALWLEASYVQCIHPYEKRALGYTDVCASWQRLFELAQAQKSIISAEDMKVIVRGATATVTCTEQVKSKVLKAPLRSMLATNLFRKVNGRWYLVHRHVSAAGDSALGAPLLDDQPTALDGPEAARVARLLSQIAQVSGKFPADSIIIQRGRSNKGFGNIEDEEFPPHIIEAAEMEDEDTDDDSMSDNEESDMDDMLAQEEEDAVESVRDTVRALRRLSKQGLLTPKAKIQLMSEMLRNPGESMPERAHELLLVDVPEDEKDAAWDDFAALVIMEAKRIEARKAKAPEAGDWKRPHGSGPGKGRGR